MTATFILKPDNAHDRMAAAWREACRSLELDKTVRVTVAECKMTRTLAQNDKLQVLCGLIAAQVRLDSGAGKYVNAAECPNGLRLDKDSWRHIFVAAYRKTQNIVPGIDGGYVVLGGSSRDLRVGECADVIEIIYAFGAERGVEWCDGLPSEIAA